MLAENLKRLRVEKGYSQENLARKANISFRTIQMIELGKVKPNLNSLEKISEALEIKVETLLKK